MASSLRRLRIGVLGLGRRWQQRYRPAVLSLGDRFVISSVCDPVSLHAEEEARRLGCDVAGGPTELLENQDVEALLLLDAPWYQLWPLEVACRLGKPVLCAPVGALDEVRNQNLLQQVEDCRLPVLAALGPRLAAATDRLRQLLGGEIGPPRLLLSELPQPARPSRERAAAAGAAALAAIDWCLALIASPPVGVQLAEVPSAGLTSIVIEFASGQAAQVLRRPGRHPWRLSAITEKGEATIQLPDRIRWSTRSGQYLERSNQRASLTRLLLDCFHEAITEGRPPQPSLHDAWTALACLKGAARSGAEDGRRVPLEVTR